MPAGGRSRPRSGSLSRGVALDPATFPNESGSLDRQNRENHRAGKGRGGPQPNRGKRLPCLTARGFSCWRLFSAAPSASRPAASFPCGLSEGSTSSKTLGRVVEVSLQVLRDAPPQELDGQPLSHKVAGLREAITSAGARVGYLPPDSPALNPIALVFLKFRWLLRSAAGQTVDSLWSVCRQLLDRFTEAECRNCLRHCGYRCT